MYQFECFLYLKSTENSNLTKSSQIPYFGFGPFIYIYIYNQPSFIIYVIYSPICIILLDNTHTTFILYNISVAQYKKLKCKKCQDSGDLISRIDTEVTVGALPP